MEKFEYKTLFAETTGFFGGEADRNKFQSELNELGAQGWELVSTVTTASSGGMTRLLISLFKRKLP